MNAIITEVRANDKTVVRGKRTLVARIKYAGLVALLALGLFGAQLLVATATDGAIGGVTPVYAGECNNGTCG